MTASASATRGGGDTFTPVKGISVTGISVVAGRNLVRTGVSLRTSVAGVGAARVALFGVVIVCTVEGAPQVAESRIFCNAFTSERDIRRFEGDG